MRNWHPYKLEGQERNTNFYITVQFADSDASNALCCSRRVFEWGGKQTRRVQDKKVPTESHQFLPNLQQYQFW